MTADGGLTYLVRPPVGRPPMEDVIRLGCFAGELAAAQALSDGTATDWPEAVRVAVSCALVALERQGYLAVTDPAGWPEFPERAL